MPEFSSLLNATANQTAGSGSALDPDVFYKPKPESWFKSLPYAFKASINGKSFMFYLPINPSNISIVTHYATNIVSTLYSTVEEHSEQRYFDITIQGTTGFAPKFISAYASDPKTDKLSAESNPGRTSYADGSIFGGAAGGFFAKTLGKLDQAANKASDAMNTALGNARPYQAGVFLNTSGYMAFHNLYRFFLDYKRSAAKGAAIKNQDISIAGGSAQDGFSIASLSKSTGVSPLYFLNFKDNNQYSCAIQRFVLERNAENPMLYNYSIQLRAYNLKQLSAVESFSLADRIKELGLTTKPSILSRFKLSVRNAKSAINSVGGALTTLGG